MVEPVKMSMSFRVVLVFLGSVFLSDQGMPNHGFAAPAHLLAIYRVANSEQISYQSLFDGTATPAGLYLKTPPVLSDVDFVAWNVTNHTFVITPAAAKRLAVECCRNKHPFVLTTSGEPVFLGLFDSNDSSLISGVPVILTDWLLTDCFEGWTNLTAEDLQLAGSDNPAALKHLMTMTNVTTNVTLRIDRRYPAADCGKGPDRREDMRIVAAVEKLFGNSKP